MLKRLFTFFVLICCFFKTSTAQSIYTFVGNGNWTEPSNWENNIVPPLILSNGSQIVINPADNGECVVNVPVQIPATALLKVLPGKKLRIMGDLIVDYDPSADGLFIDPRDNQIYPFKHIGTQVWMTKNMNFYSYYYTWCYNLDGSNCDKYGKLYNHYVAFGAVPPGWHLPSNAEWDTLITYLGGANIAGGAMKETIEWA